MRPLPASPFDACDQASAVVTAQSLVRYKTKDYSVPVAYGHQDVWVRGYVDKVVIGRRGEIIARDPRCWDREDVVFDPVHYLPLIEQKINSLDQAAPLQGWDLPEEFATLRRLMEGRMARHGRREYVQVLRLLESFDLAAIPKLNKMQVLELARCEWIERRENVIAFGPSGTGKTHVALGLGLAGCQKGLSVGFTTAAALVSEMMEARDERRQLRFQKQMAAYKLLIIDELGFVPLSKTGAELLFELNSQR
jgi:hypothetical protein